MPGGVYPITVTDLVYDNETEETLKYKLDHIFDSPTITTPTINGGTLKDVTLNGSTQNNSNIIGVQASKIALNTPTINGGTINTPTITNPNISGGKIEGELNTDKATFKGGTFYGCTSYDEDIYTPNIHGGKIDSTTINTSTINEATINDSTLKGDSFLEGNLNNKGRIHNGIIDDVHLNDSILGDNKVEGTISGGTFTDITLDGTVNNNGKIVGGELNDSKQNNSHVTNGILDYPSINQGEISDSTISNGEIDNVHVTKANIEDSDFEGSVIDSTIWNSTLQGGEFIGNLEGEKGTIDNISLKHVKIVDDDNNELIKVEHGVNGDALRINGGSFQSPHITTPTIYGNHSTLMTVEELDYNDKEYLNIDGSVLRNTTSYNQVLYTPTIYGSKLGSTKEENLELTDPIIKDKDGNVIYSAIDGINCKTIKVDGKEVITKADVDNRIKELIGTAPEALDTLGEIAEEFKKSEDLHTAIQTEMASKISRKEVEDGYVQKISGKGLSTNDFTTAEKNKLEAYPTYLELSTTISNKADKSQIPTKTSDLTNNSGFITSVGWSDINNKPTTLSGYGITDAKIENGKITLGVNSITPLTSHQSLSNYYTKTESDNRYLSSKFEKIDINSSKAFDVESITPENKQYLLYNYNKYLTNVPPNIGTDLMFYRTINEGASGVVILVDIDNNDVYYRTWLRGRWGEWIKVGNKFIENVIEVCITPEFTSDGISSASVYSIPNAKKYIDGNIPFVLKLLISIDGYANPITVPLNYCKLGNDIPISFCSNFQKFFVGSCYFYHNGSSEYNLLIALKKI